MKSSIITAAAAGCALAVVPGLAVAAAAPAGVTVTIKAEGTDMFGVVKSPKPAKCADDRTVKVYKLVHGEPHLWATDTTELQGKKGVWSTGNTGTEGRFFAKVGKKPGCKGDVSPTIRVQRND
jgi:hypothetical protein